MLIELELIQKKKSKPMTKIKIRRKDWNAIPGNVQKEIEKNVVINKGVRTVWFTVEGDLLNERKEGNTSTDA